MSNIFTGLPAPAAALNGLESARSLEIKSEYSVIDSGQDYWVSREFNGNIKIRAANGSVRSFTTSASGSYESSFVISGTNIIFVRKDLQNDHYAEVVSISDGSTLATLFLVKDDGFASVISDNGKVLFFKSEVAKGFAGRAWAYSLDLTNFNITQLHLSDGVYTDAVVHLFSDAGVYYRSYQSAAVSKISRLTQTTLDGDGLFGEVPAQGETIIQDSNNNYLFFPQVYNGKVYVMSSDATQIATWDANGLNVQGVPITIDTRTPLQHEFSKVQYERFQFDTNLNILFDTRTFFAFDILNEVEITDRYPLCLSSEASTSYTFDVSDRQPVRVFSYVNQKYAFYRADSENFLVILDNNPFCPVIEPGAVKQQNIVDGARTIVGVPLSEHIGEVNLTPAYDGAPLYQDNFLTITYQNTSLFVNGFTHTVPSDPSLVCRTEFENNYYIRFQGELRRFNSAGADTTFAADALQSPQRYSFVYDGSWFVITDTELFTYNFADETSATITINYQRPNRVRLFVDPFETQLYLYDRDEPNLLRRLLFKPQSFDFTDASQYSAYTETVTTNFPSSQNKGIASANWSITQVDAQTILTIDYEAAWYEKALRQVFLVETNTGLNIRTPIEPGSSITTSGTYIFDRNVLEVFRTRFLLVPANTFVLEFLGGTVNDGLVPPVDSRVAVSTSDEGFLKMLHDGVIGAPNADTSYEAVFNRTYPREDYGALDLNSLRLIFRDNIRGNDTVQAVIKDVDLIKYTVTPDVLLKTKSSYVGTKVDASEAKEVRSTILIEAVVSTDVLENMLNIFYSQWSSASLDGRWEVLLDDRIYPVNSQTGREEIFDSGLVKYVRYSCAVTNVIWDWFSEETYKITMDLKEI